MTLLVLVALTGVWIVGTLPLTVAAARSLARRGMYDAHVRPEPVDDRHA